MSHRVRDVTPLVAGVTSNRRCDVAGNHANLNRPTDWHSTAPDNEHTGAVSIYVKDS